jgi:protein SCO1/2
MESVNPSQCPTRAVHGPAGISVSYLLIVVTAALFGLCGCDRIAEEPGKYAVTYQTDSLPDLTLTDQYGHQLSLASLRGKPVLFDFIYTSCPGPCQLLTQHMKLIADKLGPALGREVSFVSVTVDPEHDRPSRLFDYAKAFNANRKGWYFLTGSTTEIDELMRVFRLVRERENEGEIDHVLGYFLVGPDGHLKVEYSQRVEPSTASRDVEEAATGNTLIGRLGFAWRRWT